MSAKKFSVNSGSLPQGVSLDRATGTIKDMTTPREIAELAKYMHEKCGGRCADWINPCAEAMARDALRNYATLLAKQAEDAEDAARWRCARELPMHKISELAEIQAVHADVRDCFIDVQRAAMQEKTHA